MTLESSSEGKAVVIKLGGRMDAESSGEFDAACQHAIQDGARHVVVDLANLQYISSAGLGSILRAAKKLQSMGGAVTLCGVKGLVKEVFEVTHLLSLFKVFDSAEAACQNI